MDLWQISKLHIYVIDTLGGDKHEGLKQKRKNIMVLKKNKVERTGCKDYIKPELIYKPGLQSGRELRGYWISRRLHFYTKKARAGLARWLGGQGA